MKLVLLLICISLLKLYPGELNIRKAIDEDLSKTSSAIDQILKN